MQKKISDLRDISRKIRSFQGQKVFSSSFKKFFTQEKSILVWKNLGERFGFKEKIKINFQYLNPNFF